MPKTAIIGHRPPKRKKPLPPYLGLRDPEAEVALETVKHHKCPRCIGGWLLYTDSEPVCVNCGYRPRVKKLLPLVEK